MIDKKSWYEQDYFWETVETIMFDQQRLSKASLEINNIIKLLEIKKGANILSALKTVFLINTSLDFLIAVYKDSMNVKITHVQPDKIYKSTNTKLPNNSFISGTLVDKIKINKVEAIIARVKDMIKLIPVIFALYFDLE